MLERSWDETILAEELQALHTIDLDFDVGLTGFSIAEIDGLIEGLRTGDRCGRLNGS